jgi:hypothetical protein
MHCSLAKRRFSWVNYFHQTIQAIFFICPSRHQTGILRVDANTSRYLYVFFLIRANTSRYLYVFFLVSLGYLYVFIIRLDTSFAAYVLIPIRLLPHTSWIPIRFFSYVLIPIRLCSHTSRRLFVFFISLDTYTSFSAYISTPIRCFFLIRLDTYTSFFSYVSTPMDNNSPTRQMQVEFRIGK